MAKCIEFFSRLKMREKERERTTTFSLELLPHAPGSLEGRLVAQQRPLSRGGMII